jgi:CHAT domain-containing protein
VVESGRTRILSERLEGRRAPPPIPLTRGRGEVLVSYWVAPRRSFAWVAGPSGVTLFTLPGEPRLRALVEAYRASLETSLRDPLVLERSPGRELYDILVAPWAGGLASGTRVCVSPDGPLHAVPFAALIAPGPRPHYWIEDAVITVAPSLASLPETAGPLRAGGAVLALGDAPASGPDFPRLPYARAELDALVHHFGAARVTVAGGSQARPEAYLAVDPGRFSIIHFAAHAMANPSSPLDSTIVLAPGARGDRLSVREVVRLPLSADLVTLSACRSAGARAYAGVGLVGLTWGFMMAGARQVVAGLWDVADRSTAALMDRLYAGLAGGQDPAQALRAAQLVGLRAHETPFHWAAFNLYRGPRR